LNFQLTEEASVDELGAMVRAGIRRNDPPEVGPRDYVPLGIALRADGRLVGGVYGATMWRWLMIEGLWVSEEFRGQGFGERLMAAAEAAAIARRCRAASLGTFDFQARRFYEKLGYKVFGELEEFPTGHRHYEMWKLLGSA
jgi:ribosomal protein S18 acetylase RimI-like enzyme